MLEIVERPQNSVTYPTGVWLATQRSIRGDFDPEERTELDMLILKAWRRNPAQAGADLAELIAELPEGMRSTLVQAADKAGRRKLGYVVRARRGDRREPRPSSSRTSWRTGRASRVPRSRRTTRTGCCRG